MSADAASTLLMVDVAAECRVVGRVNRFVVEVEVPGRGRLRVHLNNTGRLVDVLVPGRRGFCTSTLGRGRLAYRLSFIEYHGGYAVLDTLLQEKAFARAVEAGLLPWLQGCRVEARSPRVAGEVFDYLLSCPSGRVVVETKSAVLASSDGYALYPDTRTERGERHMRRLGELAERGLYRALVVFIAAFPGAKGFRPNKSVDPGFAAALREAVEKGVEARSIGLRFNPCTRSVELYSPDLPVVLV